MKSFLKFTLASILGFVLGSLIIFFISMGFISALISAQDKPAEVKPNSIFVLKLDHEIVERYTENPFANFSPMQMEPEKQLGLNMILENIKKAKSNENIRGIYLDLSFIPAGIATIEEIRTALLDFKSSGKFVYAYGNYFTQTAYYLATAADKIYLQPEGAIELVGLRSQVLFFKEMLEKIGIEPQVIRHGEFKAAVEPFIRKSMSEKNREQIETFVGSIWNNMVDSICKARNIDREHLNNLIDELEISKDPMIAVDEGLIDGTRYKDEVINELKELTDTDKSKDINAVNVFTLNKVPKIRLTKGLAKDKIAIVFAYGPVRVGEEGEGTIASERISRAIRKARRDSSIKAIVFRVNSGGGSALASDVILREVKLAAQVKPVIASMGDVAASGGYYVLAQADKIIASPNTITGSIGVFGIIPNAKEFFNDKLGISVDIVKTNKHSDYNTIFRPLDPKERSIIKHNIERVYDRFTQAVANGRGVTQEYVDSVGQGRVWSGTNALELNLIDEYGGLNDAVEMAVEMAEVEKYRIVELPELEDPIEQIIKKLTGEAQTWMLKKELGESYKYYKSAQKFIHMNGVQAIMPMEIELY